MQTKPSARHWPLLLLVLLPVVLARAVPAKLGWTVVSQSDGTTVEVCPMGDERLHYFMTRDSVVVVADRHGDMVYAETSGLRRLVATDRLAHEAPQRAAQERALAIKVRQAEALRPYRSRHASPLPAKAWVSPASRAKAGHTRQTPNDYTGVYHQMVILVDFQDKRFRQDSEPSELWNDLFNTYGYTGLGKAAQGSVAEYFYDQSYGQLHLTFDVYGPVTLSKNHTYYGENNVNGDDKHPGAMIREAIAQLQQTNTVDDWTLFDWDDDGWMEQVLIIYAGMGENDNVNQPDLIWPHQWDLESEGEEDENGQFGNVTVNTPKGKLTVSNYCMISELDSQKAYGSFGVICHEYSHCLGLPDSYETANDFASVTSSWDLMSTGSYNGNGLCPAGYSAYQRWCCGWMEPEDLTGSTTVSQMPPLSETGVSYRLRNECPNDSVDEYYLIENRQKEKWDSRLPGSGLLITHVDFSWWHWFDNSVNNDAKHRRYSIVAANNGGAVGGWAYPYKDNDSLTSRSMPQASVFNTNVKGNNLLGLYLYDLKVSDDGTGGFRVASDNDDPKLSIGRPIPLDQPADVYRLNGQLLWHTQRFRPEQLPDDAVYAVRFGDGTVRKLRR